MPNDGSGEGIHFFHAQMHLQGKFERQHHAVHPDAIGNEIGGILRVNNSLTQQIFSDIHHRLDDFRQRVPIGNNFQQMHVAWWIKEMGNQKTTAEILRQIGGNFVHRKTGSVGAYDCFRFQVGENAPEKLLLDVHPLHHRFNNPICFLEAGKVVVVIAGGYSFGVPGTVKGGWFCLLRRLQPFLSKLLFDVEKQGGDSHISQVGCNLASHDSGAQYRHFFDFRFHGASSFKAVR